MKKAFFYIMAVAILTTACDKDDDKYDEPEVEPNQITMTTEGGSLVYIDIEIRGSGTITIDWGDNVIETDSLINNVDQAYRHTYSDASSAHTITITGDDIEHLDCFHNQLTNFDASKNPKLQYLDCSYNQLTNLDVSKNPKLQYLDCSHNQLTNLDVSKNPELQYLYCRYNRLTNLDVSKNSELSDLQCFDNRLTNLDVSKNSELSNLDCGGNQLTNLDVSKNPELSILQCRYNQLTNLDVSKNPKLRYLDCGFNILTSDALNAMFGTLHSNIISGQVKQIYILGNPGTNDCDRSIAENKGWNMYYGPFGILAHIQIINNKLTDEKEIFSHYGSRCCSDNSL